jgi:hypothetical protein
MIAVRSAAASNVYLGANERQEHVVSMAGAMQDKDRDANQESSE